MEIKIKDNGNLVDATVEMIDGVMVVSPVTNISEDYTKFTTGDIITCGWENEFEKCSWVFILDGKIEKCNEHYFQEEFCGAYLSGINENEPFWINYYSDSAEWVRYATDEEKQKLFDKLNEEGYEWDAEKKELVKLKWKPKMGEVYYCPWFSYKDLQFVHNDFKWESLDIDNTIYSKGCCFRSKEECQAFVDKLNQAIKSVKP